MYDKNSIRIQLRTNLLTTLTVNPVMMLTLFLFLFSCMKTKFTRKYYHLHSVNSVCGPRVHVFVTHLVNSIKIFEQAHIIEFY